MAQKYFQQNHSNNCLSLVYPGPRIPNAQNQKKEFPISYNSENIQNKERILNAAREKDQVTQKDRPISITAEFSRDILKTMRVSDGVLQVLKDHRKIPR